VSDALLPISQDWQSYRIREKYILLQQQEESGRKNFKIQMLEYFL
jgi:hypothetical protein